MKTTNFNIYTYEFMPFVQQPTLFTFGQKQLTLAELKEKKQDIFAKYIDMIVEGKLIPKLGDKEYKCKPLFHQGGITVLVIENLKDESYPKDFGDHTMQIGPYCHIIIDNRKDFQHITIESKREAFSSTNVVRNILYETLRPLLKYEGLLLEMNPQFLPKEFWDYIKLHKAEGIEEIRFYFPYPNLPAISDKYGQYLKDLGLDYNCMPGLILYAPGDMVMDIRDNDPQMEFRLKAAGESGIPIAIKAKGKRIHYCGKNKCVTWPLDSSLLATLDKTEQKDGQLLLFPEEGKLSKEQKLAEYLNRGRFKVGD